MHTGGRPPATPSQDSDRAAALAHTQNTPKQPLPRATRMAPAARPQNPPAGMLLAALVQTENAQPADLFTVSAWQVLRVRSSAPPPHTAGSARGLRWRMQKEPPNPTQPWRAVWQLQRPCPSRSACLRSCCRCWRTWSAPPHPTKRSAGCMAAAEHPQQPLRLPAPSWQLLADAEVHGR